MLEHEWISDVDFSLDLIVHSINVSLVDTHALLGERRRIVDRNVVQLRVVAPVFI